MWLWLLFLLCLLFFYKKREPLTIHLDDDLYDRVHKYAWLPMYRTILGFIPFKYHYRKARQYFKSS